MIDLHAKSKREYPVEGLCRLFGKTKQAYYKYDEERMMTRMSQEVFAVDFIKQVREKDCGIGGMKIRLMYKREFAGKSPLGRDRFEDVIDKYGLKLRRKTRKPTTTNSSHGLPTYPNLIKDFIPTAPNQLWVSDITYIPIIHGTGNYRFCYLTIIMDGYKPIISA